MGNLNYNKIEIKSKRVLAVVDELKDQYMEADRTCRPWIIGFSGGKDSTTLLMLTWISMLSLREEGKELRRRVYVVSKNNTTARGYFLELRHWKGVPCTQQFLPFLHRQDEDKAYLEVYYRSSCGRWRGYRACGYTISRESAARTLNQKT